MKQFLFLLFISLAPLAKSQNTWLAKSNFPGTSRTGAVAFSIGGKGYLGTGSNWNGVYYDDFWEYDPVTDTWAQKAALPGIARYRSMGFANATKGYVGTGQTNSLLNDFWEYDPVANTWTAKSNVGVLGRCAAAGFIIDDKIYLGTGYLSGLGMAKDFWEYDILTNAWSQKADFGGIEEAYATGFAIGSKGYLGTGSDMLSSGIGNNDFWEYDPAGNSWTQKNNFPGTGRSEAVGFSIGNFGFIGTGTQNWGNGAMADMWKYDPATDSWLQMAPFPGGIREHASCFVIDCKAYISTGFSNDDDLTLMNDLWEYTPDFSCGVGAIFSADNQLCPGTCIDFTNLSVNATSYSWSFPGGVPSSSTDVNPVNICYYSPGNYNVTLIASSAIGSDTLLLVNYITVYPQPPPQGITQSGDTLFANPGATSYQWYYNGNILNGATNYFYVAQASGDYNVVATDQNNCEVEAVINDVIASSQFAPDSYQDGSLQLAIVPNPVTSTFDIIGLKNNSADEIKILNVLGEEVYAAVNYFPDGYREPIVNCTFLPSGLYYIEVTSGKKIFRGKFVKQ